MSLRTKLFLSVGCVLLGVAILSYLLPKIWIKRDVDTASFYLNKKIQSLENKLLNATSFLISFRLLQSKAALVGTFDMIFDLRKGMQTDEKLGSGFAAKLATYNPDVAFAEISNKETFAVIPEDALLYSPLWAIDAKNELVLQIPQKNAFFSTWPLSGGPKGVYFLKEVKDVSSFTNLSFQSFKREEIDQNEKSTNEALFQSIMQSENEWAQKAAMIRLLVNYGNEEFTDGILQINSSSGAACLLSEEVFSQKKIEGISFNQPSYILRQSVEGITMDLAEKRILSPDQTIALGFSFSKIVKKLALILKKPILIFLNGKLALAFSDKGNVVNTDQIAFSQNSVTLEGKKHTPYKIKIDQDLSIEILGEEAAINAIPNFLKQLRDKLIAKISLNLIGAALLIFLIALFFLSRIARRITKPISLLAEASKEIGKGKYENVHLPSVNHRNDEIGVLVHSFEGMVESLKEREKIRSVLNKVVSKEIASEILKGTIELKGEERVLSIVFSDIRGFTRLSEKLSPHVLIRMLNEYMTEMCRVIDETHGVVDKFVGDEIMALYGAPLFFEKHAIKAIEAAILMMQTLTKWNEKQRAKKEPTFEVGIGIHTGLAYAGSMGAENRLNYTVVGASVNFASRICSHALPMQILISEETLNSPGVRGRFHYKALEPVHLKGIEHPVVLYEIQDSIK